MTIMAKNMDTIHPSASIESSPVLLLSHMVRVGGNGGKRKKEKKEKGKEKELGGTLFQWTGGHYY